MKWQKGQSGNPAGRPKGSTAKGLNKATERRVLNTLADAAMAGDVGSARICALWMLKHDQGLILPANDGHPVKRIQYATEVNHDKTNSSKEDYDPETVFKAIQG